MKSCVPLAALVALFATPVLAHTIFQELYVNGVSQGHLNAIRYPTYDGPVSDVTTNSIICNGDPNPLVTPYSQTIVNVAAGSTITHEWHHTLTSKGTGDAEDPIAASHKGPVMVYLAKVPSATQTDVTGLKWFKIAEDGLDSNGVWGVDRLISSGGKATATIPSCIPPGNYLLRAEIIALHSASSYPGAQFYMECAQINVTGGGSTSPATVSFPGAYKGSDPGITVNIYGGSKTYTIPGPRPFSCSGGGQTSVAPTNPTTTTTSSKPATTTPTSSGCTTTKYSQCGGIGWTGCTVCVSSTCTKSGDYYSQCL